MDPVELRRRNLLGQDELPYTEPERDDLSSTSRRCETLEQAVAMLDYEAFRAEQRRA